MLFAVNYSFCEKIKGNKLTSHQKSRGETGTSRKRCEYRETYGYFSHLYSMYRVVVELQ